MALPIRSALRSAGRFMVRNPLSLLTVAKHAVNMRMAVPLDAIRWVVSNTPPSKKAPTDVAITARPPAIQVGATVEMMGTKLRASTTIAVEELRVYSEEMTIRLRLTDLTGIQSGFWCCNIIFMSDINCANARVIGVQAKLHAPVS